MPVVHQQATIASIACPPAGTTYLYVPDYDDDPVGQTAKSSLGADYSPCTSSMGVCGNFDMSNIKLNIFTDCTVQLVGVSTSASPPPPPPEAPPPPPSDGGDGFPAVAVGVGVGAGVAAVGAAAAVASHANKKPKVAPEAPDGSNESPPPKKVFRLPKFFRLPCF